VESNYLSPFLVQTGVFSESSAAATISAYGVFVTIGSWLAATLSGKYGPKRIMTVGAVAWAVFEILFLAVGIHGGVTWVASAAYALRGIGYPFFSYAFLIWLNTGTPSEHRGAAVGWFWFMFGAGLPTLGSFLASITIPLVGEYNTFWISLGLVVIGAVMAIVGIKDKVHAGPLTTDLSRGESAFIRAITILKREPRVAAGGFVRLVNTVPNFGLFVVAPFFFTQKIGFNQREYLEIVTIVYTANFVANLFFGYIGDRVGWQRTVTWFGCVMSGIGVLLLYYIPLAVGPNFLVTILCWSVYSVGLAAYTPLTALMPSMVPDDDKGNALAVYSLAAGLSAFVGPLLVATMGGVAHMAELIWVFAAMYFVAAFVNTALKTDADPGRARRLHRVDEAGRSRNGVDGEPARAD